MYYADDYRFSCHKVFFCLRSDYFKALLRDHFDENHGQHNMASITLHDITVDTFKAILYYVYTDYCEVSIILISIDHVILNTVNLSSYQEHNNTILA